MVKFPEELLKCRNEVKIIQEYLDSVKTDKSFDIDNKILEPYFKIILDTFACEYFSTNFVEGFTEIFIFNVQRMYEEIGTALATDNIDLIGVFIMQTIIAVFSKISQYSKNNEEITWN